MRGYKKGSKMVALKSTLNKTKVMLKKQHSAYVKRRTAQPIAGIENIPTELPEESIAIGRMLLAAVQVDRVSYIPTEDPRIQLHRDTIKTLESHSPADDEIEENEELESLKKDDLTPPPPDLSAPLTQFILRAIAPLPSSINEKQHTTGLCLAGLNLKSEFFPKTALSRFDNTTKEEIGLDGQLLSRMLSHETDLARANPSDYQTTTITVQKIQRAIQVYQEGRAADSLTILKNIRNEDPHNRLLSFVLANILYHRTAHGNNKFLPEARQEGKKAASDSKKFNANILRRFKYHYIATDSAFAPDKTISLLREHALYKIPEIQELDNDDYIIYVKSMILLSMTNHNKWQKEEIIAIKEFAECALGGGLLYCLFFEQKILSLLFNEKEDTRILFEPLKEVQETIRIIQNNLASFHETISKNTLEDEKKNTAHMWTINKHLLQECIKHIPIPELSDILTNTSLDGRQYGPTETLDRILREKELKIGEYWPLWVAKLNFKAASFMPESIPNWLVIDEKPVLEEYEKALAELKQEETKIIDKEKWSLSHYYQTPFNYENLMEVGIKRSFTQTTFAPMAPSLKSHYQVWGVGRPQGLLISDIIEQRARAGAFASTREIQAAFEGAYELLYDKTYGIKERQNKAWKRYTNMQDKSQQASTNNQDYLQKLFAEMWWFFLIIIPASLAAFAITASSDTFEQGAKTFILVIIVSVLISGGFLAIRKGRSISSSLKSYAEDIMDNDPDYGQTDSNTSLQDIANMPK